MRRAPGSAFVGVLLCMSLFACAENGSNAPKEPIYVRAQGGLTGATSNLAPALMRAQNDYIRELNANGGIAGHPITILGGGWEDTGYTSSGAISIYQNWRQTPDWDKVVTILGWGTPEAVGLRDLVTEDRLPMLVGTYAGSLATPVEVHKTITLPDASQYVVNTPAAPYVFFSGTDYSTSIRSALQFVSSIGGRKISLQVCASPYCMDPIPAGKSYAAELGMEILPDLTVEFSFDQAAVDQAVQGYVAAHGQPEWLWSGTLTPWTAKIAKAVKTYSPQTKMIVNVWGFDETLYPQCGTACVGTVYGVAPFAVYGDTRQPGMAEVVALNNKYRQIDGEDPTPFNTTFYVRGIALLRPWVAAVERAASVGPITRETIRTALESLNAFDMGGLTTPLSFTATDHRPGMGAHIYSINEFGKFNYETEITVERRNDWIGW